MAGDINQVRTSVGSKRGGLGSVLDLNEGASAVGRDHLGRGLW